MNHLRRRWSAVLVLLVASSVAACTDENVTVSADEPPMAEFPPNRWVDLPRSPVGDWDSFNWVFLADRSGFVHAGAATTDPDGTVTSTPAAAFFSFEERRFIRLPDLPVTSGVGRAGGARVGDTMVIVTACHASSAREGIDFLPLTVDYREYTYASGRIPGGFFKREGKATEKETLTSRLIDRPIRPLFPAGWSFETQIIAMAPLPLKKVKTSMRPRPEFWIPVSIAIVRRSRSERRNAAAVTYPAVIADAFMTKTRKKSTLICARNWRKAWRFPRSRLRGWTGRLRLIA